MDLSSNGLYDDDQVRVRDMLPDRETNEAVTESFRAKERADEQVRLDRQFTEINRQICALSSLVRKSS